MMTTRTLLPSLAAVGSAFFGITVNAAPIAAEADTWIQTTSDLGNGTDRSGDTPSGNLSEFLSVRDIDGRGNPANVRGLERAAVIRFGLAGLTAPSIGSSLSLVVQRGDNDTGIGGTLQLYGVTENAAVTPSVPTELTFTEGNFSASDANAVDNSTNLVQEPYIFAGAAGTTVPTTNAIAVLDYTDANTATGSTITFSDPEIDRYLNERLAAGATSASFVLTLDSTTERDGIGRGTDTELRFDSLNTDGGVAPSFNVVPEPSTAVLIGLGGLTMLRRRRG